MDNAFVVLMVLVVCVGMPLNWILTAAMKSDKVKKAGLAYLISLIFGNK